MGLQSQTLQSASMRARTHTHTHTHTQSLLFFCDLKYPFFLMTLTEFRGILS